MPPHPPSLPPPSLPRSLAPSSSLLLPTLHYHPPPPLFSLPPCTSFPPSRTSVIIRTPRSRLRDIGYNTRRGRYNTRRGRYNTRRGGYNTSAGSETCRGGETLAVRQGGRERPEGWRGRQGGEDGKRERASVRHDLMVPLIGGPERTPLMDRPPDYTRNEWTPNYQFWAKAVKKSR